MLIDTLRLSGNPFEHYTAETEPNISEYAVRPPYLDAISSRSTGLSSFILFGERGAGKSATRITVYNDVWRDKATPKVGRLPFVVNLVDFTAVLEPLRQGRLSDSDICRLVAYTVIEHMLLWISRLSDDERRTYTDALLDEEWVSVFSLIKAFYLSIPETERQVSNKEALDLFNAALTTRGAVWINQNWSGVGRVLASITSVVAQRFVGGTAENLRVATEDLLSSLQGGNPSATRAVLSRLVQFAQIFGFSGVTVFIDKVDETSETTNSVDATTRLVYPILSHIQLLEVPGFGWIFFLWSKVRIGLADGKYKVRLDKIANANVEWTKAHLRQMVELRLKYYSGNRIGFPELFELGFYTDAVFDGLVELTMGSPRELIRVLDIIFREHDARGDETSSRIDLRSLEIGQDKYAIEVVGSWYDPKKLQQIYRIGKTKFINKDVQGKFRIGDQGARQKIQQWEDASLVKLSGTVPSEHGSKPSNQYEISDPRVKRIVDRRLDVAVGADLDHP